MARPPRTPEDDELLDADGIAEWLVCTPEEVDRSYREEGLPARSIADDGRLLFCVGDVRRWLRRPDPHGDET